MYIFTISSLQDKTKRNTVRHKNGIFHSHKQKLLFCMRERKKAMDSC